MNFFTCFKSVDTLHVIKNEHQTRASYVPKVYTKSLRRSLSLSLSLSLYLSISLSLSLCQQGAWLGKKIYCIPELQVRGVCRARWAMRGGLVAGALHGARIVCNAMRCARVGCIRAVRCAVVALCCATRSLHGMRCVRAGCRRRRGELVAVAGAGGAMLLTTVLWVVITF